MDQEYDAFKRLTDALENAAAAAVLIAQIRPDQSKQWYKMAEAYRVALQAVWQLAGEGNLTRKN